MTKVEVATPANTRFDELIVSRELPDYTRERVKNLIAGLEDFPSMGSPLTGEWFGYRYLVGPWDWFLILYTYDPSSDVVVVMNFIDARMADNPVESRS